MIPLFHSAYDSVIFCEVNNFKITIKNPNNVLRYFTQLSVHNYGNGNTSYKQLFIAGRDLVHEINLGLTSVETIMHLP